MLRTIKEMFEMVQSTNTPPRQRYERPAPKLSELMKRIDPFDKDTPLKTWDQWRSSLEKTRDRHLLDEDDMSTILDAKLIGRARHVLESALDDKAKTRFEVQEMFDILDTEFSSEKAQRDAKDELYDCCQGANESISDFSNRIQRWARKAFPGDKKRIRAEWKDNMIRGIYHEVLRFQFITECKSHADGTMGEIVKELEVYECRCMLNKPKAELQAWTSVSTESSDECQKPPKEAQRLYVAVTADVEESEIWQTYAMSNTPPTNRFVSNHSLMKALTKLSNQVLQSRNYPSVLVPVPEMGWEGSAWTKSMIDGWVDWLRKVKRHSETARKSEGAAEVNQPPLSTRNRGFYRGGSRGRGRAGPRKQPGRAETQAAAGSKDSPTKGADIKQAKEIWGCLKCGKKGHWRRECPQNVVHFCDDHAEYLTLDERGQCTYCTYGQSGAGSQLSGNDSENGVAGM